MSTARTLMPQGVEQHHQAVGSALERLKTGVASLKALRPRADEKIRLERAAERARAQFLGRPEPRLTIALAGCTGAGKSTLINALARAPIAESSEIRPTTRVAKVYHHRDAIAGGLPRELADQALFVPHDRPELRLKVIVDTPDLDSFAVEHRAATKALLKAAHLVLYVFSPEKNMEERVWSVLKEEIAFSHAIAVLNKADQASARDLELITADLRQRFADVGLPDIRIFRVCALAHLPGNSEMVKATSTIDQMVDLKAFIEEELREGDMMRMVRAQRRKVVEALEAEVERIAPLTIRTQLQDLSEIMRNRGEAAAERLSKAVEGPLATAEEEFAPLATIRQHERFWGPFRSWLAMIDFLHYGMTGMIRRLVGRPPRGEPETLQRIFEREGGAAVEDTLKAEARDIQDKLHRLGLPLERWRSASEATSASDVLSEAAREMKTRFDAPAAKNDARGKVVVWAGSILGGVVPLAFVIYVFVRLAIDFWQGAYRGWDALVHLVTLVGLYFIVLQLTVNALLIGTRKDEGKLIGRQTLRDVMTRLMRGWLHTYKTDLEADLAALHEPMTVIRDAAAFEDEGAEETADAPGSSFVLSAPSPRMAELPAPSSSSASPVFPREARTASISRPVNGNGEVPRIRPLPSAPFEPPAASVPTPAPIAPPVAPAFSLEKERGYDRDWEGDRDRDRGGPKQRPSYSDPATAAPSVPAAKFAPTPSPSPAPAPMPASPPADPAPALPKRRKTMQERLQEMEERARQGFE